MATDQSLFGNEPNTPTTSGSGAAAGTQTQNENPLATLLAGIRNESGAQKYNSVEEALRGAQHAQEYIATLKREKEDAERRLQEATRTATEYQGKLSEQDELKRTVDALTQQFKEKANQTGSQGLTAEQLAELVNSQLTQREQALLAQTNQATVVNKIKERFGDKAEEVYNAAAAESGLSVKEFNDLAAKSPKAVLKVLGISDQPALKSNQFGPGSTTVNTASFQPNHESFIGRNKVVLPIGASNHDLQEESVRANKMVEELHAQGLSIDDLVKPSTYFKLFK